jgi:hypothetical protein
MSQVDPLQEGSVTKESLLPDGSWKTPTEDVYAPGQGMGRLQVEATHPSRTLHFDAEGELTCPCDGACMRQMLSNSLGNALQHGSEGGRVELSIFSNGEDITLAVRNHGPPISPDVLPTILDPLVCDTLTDAMRERRVGSIGLGLYIAPEIVTSHGGAMDVASSAESGTVFTIRMPRPQAGAFNQGMQRDAKASLVLFSPPHDGVINSFVGDAYANTTHCYDTYRLKEVPSYFWSGLSIEPTAA